MRRKYLVVCLLPKPQAEHAKIVDAVRHHSGGDFKIAFSTANARDGGVIGYVFTSETLPWQMGFGLLNGDSSIVMELGELYAADGMNVPAAWLRSHQAPR